MKSDEFERNARLLYDAQRVIMDNVTGFVLTCVKEGYLENLVRAGEKMTQAIKDEVPDISNKRGLKIQMLTRQVAERDVELNKMRAFEPEKPPVMAIKPPKRKRFRKKTDDEIMEEASDKAYGRKLKRPKHSGQ